MEGGRVAKQEAAFAQQCRRQHGQGGDERQLTARSQELVSGG